MLEETLLHKGSAEEWNSVMIDEHLPGKPLQHNLSLGKLDLYRENACMAGEVEGGGDNNVCIHLCLSFTFTHPLVLILNKDSYCIHRTYSTYTSKMNSLNALGNRQISSLQADLAKMENGESGPSVQG
jgi:hypothetical protein